MTYPVINESFNSGVIAPTLDGQNRIEPRERGLQTALNMLARVEGDLYFRGGTVLVNTVKDSSKEGRILPFVFSNDQAYVIDVEPGSFRFVSGDGNIIKSVADTDAWATGTEYAVDAYVAHTGVLFRCTQTHTTDHEPGVAADWTEYWGVWGEGDPYEISNGYSATNVAELNRTQSADVFFMADGEHKITTLSRYDHDDWRLADFEAEDGPYLDVNLKDECTLKPSATTGTVTITASGTDFEPFESTDVGRHVRLRHGDVGAYTVGWGIITEVTDSTHVKLDVKRDFGTTTATEIWWLGAWSETTGYPKNVGFINQAFAASYTKTQSQTVWKSNDIDIYDFGPTDENAEVQDNNGFSKTIGGSDQINPIHSFAWAQYLVLFTGGGVWRLVTTSNEPIKPSNGTFRLDCGVKAAAIDPVRIGPKTVFVQKNGKKVYALQYKFENDGLTEELLSRLGATLFSAGIKEVAYQEEPVPYLWCLLNNGKLVCMVHDANENVTGCFPVTIGGGSGGDAFVESIAVIPGDNARDHLYLRVKRTLGGSVVRTIERMTLGYTPYEDAQEEADILARQPECFYVDCGISYNGEPTHTISGLEMFNGETVRILADGAVHPEQLVEGGSISLQYAASIVHVGLGYRGYAAPARREFEVQYGTSHGKKKKLEKATLLVRESLDVQFGSSLDKLERVPLGSSNRTLGKPNPLFTGEIPLTLSGGWSLTCPDLYIAHDSPTPLEIQRIDRFISVEDT
ncbi:hypothetical protein [Pseudodesulfovibrio sediminis]|uniref:Uncharacterized protein n=1 Tax=Pseudodesulfovibrio sediminis TaxID=2810563 RepID=A0ABN6EPN0_9BACT|nr:hypothetical protein [Pseudodesulfovibrio sediminis]BCS87330.1 hypothetical protein PSDVSF_05720 [Pseudodesulfovibrio sediminis]